MMFEVKCEAFMPNKPNLHQSPSLPLQAMQLEEPNYLKGLNPPQRQAVECTEGPVMIIAGAGSGKTRVLTFRVAHLIDKGVDPFNILALTFTNKAAREMRERIQTMVGGTEAKNIWMGTFHSIFARILRQEAEKIGFPKDFTIYDTNDSRSLIKTIIKEENLDDKVYKPSIVHSRISSAKNNLISANEYLQNDDIFAEDRQQMKPKLGIIFKKYADRCFKAGAMDFDDLLYFTNILLRDFPEVLNKYQHRFRYIMVDEYQDTNYAQYLIVKRLAAKFENICVVGDDAQSIYAFRGANIQNILNFKRDYPDSNIFKLEQNYRSTKHIVNAANSIISNNKDQLKKTVWTDNEQGNPILVTRAMTDNEEGMMVARSIFETKMNEQAKDKDFAVLYRTNAQSRAIEEALRKMNIPYRIYGGLSFYDRKEIRDLMGYFRLVVNPKDEEALKRVINYPARGIGATTLDRIIVVADSIGGSLWDVISTPEVVSQAFPGATGRKLYEFATLIQSFRVELPTHDAFTLASRIATASGLLKDLYEDRTPEGVSRYENIQELLNAIKEFVEDEPVAGEVRESEIRTLSEFTAEIALITDADNDKDPENRNKVGLMTVHSAKGLEFPYVYIVGMEENLFPSQMSLTDRKDLEEERRLFYVALTRAEKRVNITYALSRFKWGNMTYGEPSRFIDELPHEHVEFIESHDNLRRQSVPLPTGNQPSIFKRKSDQSMTSSETFAPKRNLRKYDDSRQAAPVDSTTGNSGNIEKIVVGMDVIHDKFGKGKVVQLDGVAPNIKATVFFQGAGNKQLLLKFAQLRIVSSPR